MEWSDFRMKVREKAIMSIEVNDGKPAADSDSTEAYPVQELVLKMKSGAVARSCGTNLQECFDNLPEWVKAAP